MNQKMLAELAGVSPATVSKAFRYSDRVSPETRERIFAIAKEHHCYDKFAKGKYPKKLIVVFSPEIASDYYNTIVDKLESRILAANALMSLVITNFNAEKEQEYYRYYSQEGRADAIIILDPTSVVKNPDFFPTVAVFPKKQMDCDNILLDFTSAVNDAIVFLKNKGRKNIVFIGEQLTLTKLEIFKTCMENNQLPVYHNNIYISERRFENAGIWAAEQLLQQKVLPDAIVAAYDYIAFGAITTLKQHGIQIPEDISVIGMDNVDINKYVDIPLTTIQTHYDALCDAALELVMKKIENRYYFGKQDITIHASLICRDSA